MKESIYVIYALIDPRDEMVRYIGISDDMPTRFMHHLRETGARTAKGTWLAELRRYGLQPTIKILEEIQLEKTQRYKAEERERHWIRVFEQSGASLTNIRDTLSDPRKPSNWKPGKSYDRRHSASLLRGLDNTSGLPTLDQLRIRAGLRVNELADLARISTTTLCEMMNGVAVSHDSIFRVLRALSRRLGYDLPPNKVRGLRGL
jgi:predicted GIY-YIG superfamily endonuclease